MAKKWLALMLSVLLVVSMGGAAVAVDTVDSAALTAATPAWYDDTKTEFQISEFAQFADIAAMSNAGTTFEGKRFVLTGDIVCTGVFPRIGVTTPFAGELDGGGFTLSGIYLFSDKITEVMAPIVNTAETAVIRNITVSGEIDAKRGGFVGNNAGTLSGIASKLHFDANGIAGGVCMNNSGKIENCAFYGEIHNIMRRYEPSSAGICAINSGTIASSTNYGSIEGCGYVGGIFAKSTGAVSGCVNVGSVTGHGQYTGGIGARSEAEVIDCTNYAAISGEDRMTGGVLASATGATLRCVNLGDVRGTVHVGGVLGYSDGAVSDSRNSGTVTADSNGAGGIVGAGGTAVVERCVNFGTITANANNAASDTEKNNGNAGGIAGLLNGAAVIRNCANYASVTSAKSNAGGIAGKMTNRAAVMEYCLSIGDVSAPAGTPQSNLVSNNAAALRASFGVGNPGTIYSVGSASQVSNCRSYNSLSAAELTNGSLLSQLSSDRSIWAQGAHYPYQPSLGDNGANVSSEEELRTALASGAEVTLGGSIRLTSPLDITGSAVIRGQGNVITGVIRVGDGASLSLHDAILDAGGAAAPLRVTNGTVNIGALRLRNLTQAGVVAAAGQITVSGALGCDDAALPLLVCDDASTVSGLGAARVDGGAYYLRDVRPLWSESDAVALVIPAAKNAGIPVDLKPVFVDQTCYFMLPSEANTAAVTYRTLNAAGTVLAETTIDASTSASVRIKGVDFAISVMKDRLPVIYMTVDESKGSINDMNYSGGHTDACSGTFLMEVPAEFAETYGCDTSYTDTLKELRGRGNNSWAQARRDGKQPPYQIKLDKKKDLLGLGKAKTWTLLAATDANQYLKNKVSYNLARDIGMQYAPDAEMVGVYLNGTYIGLYTLAEKIQIGEERVNITDMEDVIDDAIAAGDTALSTVDITGGYLLEVDNNIDDIQIKTPDGASVTVKSPENLDTLSPSNAQSRYQYINNLVIDLFRAIYGDGYLSDGRHFTEAIGMDSLVTLLWTAEMTATSDFCRGSTFMYKDCDSIDPTLYFGPIWDCDTAFWFNTSQWLLPDRNGYSGEKLLCNALMDHREVMSYMVAYYNNNYRNLRTTYESYAAKAAALHQTYQSSMKMTNVTYHYTGTSSATTIKNYIERKGAWIAANINDPQNGLMAKATKGSALDSVPDPQGVPGGSVRLSLAATPDGATYTIQNESGNSYPKATVYLASYAADGSLLGCVSNDLALPKAAVITKSVAAAAADHCKLFVWTNAAAPLGAAAVL